MISHVRRGNLQSICDLQLCRAGIPHLSFEDVPVSSSYLTGLQVPNMSLDDPQVPASYLSPPGILEVMENEPPLKKASSVSAVVAEAAKWTVRVTSAFPR